MGSLAIRAGGNLEINGSINDGFAPPPVTPDDSGWLLLSGVQPYRGDLVVPDIGVSLAQARLSVGALLNFELPLSQTRFAAGTVLPVAGTLAQPLTLPAGTILAAAVHDATARCCIRPARCWRRRHAAGRRAPGRGQRARGDGDAGAAGPPALPRALTDDGKPSPLVLAGS